MKEWYLLRDWITAHRWLLLLVAILVLLLISPFSAVYDRNDNVISPLAAIVIMTVTLSTGPRLGMKVGIILFTVAWLVVSLVTDGSGLFAGLSVAAPVMFLILMGAVFCLLAGWLSRIRQIDVEVLCAAVCGYLIIGIFWAGLYALAQAYNHGAIASTGTATLEHGDLLYFSYTTLTTTGFGDLTPKSPVARMWSVLEAVVGTFYNAIVIARLVTLYHPPSAT